MARSPHACRPCTRAFASLPQLPSLPHPTPSPGPSLQLPAAPLLSLCPELSRGLPSSHPEAFSPFFSKPSSPVASVGESSVLTKSKTFRLDSSPATRPRASQGASVSPSVKWVWQQCMRLGVAVELISGRRCGAGTRPPRTTELCGPPLSVWALEPLTVPRTSGQ